MQLPPLIACHECDAIYWIKPLPVGGEAQCGRCGAILYREKADSLDRALALTIASLILLVVANSFPFLSLKMQTQVQSASFINGVAELYRQGMWEVATLVLFTTIVAPMVYLLGMLYVLLPLKLRLKPPYLARVFNFVKLVQPWSMAEVFLIGILVSIVKLAHLASIIFGLAFYSFAGLIIIMAWAAFSLDPRQVWTRLEIRDE